MKILVFASLIILMSQSIARAAEKGGIFIEPMLTYETSSSGTITFPAPINSSDTKVKGFGVGARLGMHAWETVFLALDGRYSMPKLEDTALNQDTDSKAWNAGPTVGLQMPMLVGLRAWGTWIMAGELDPDADKGVDEKFKKAKGFRVGAGLRVALVSLNIEYQQIEYDETEIQEVGIFTPGFNTDAIQLENKSVIFSVSMPIGI